jgi:hypothetical protein
VVGDGIMTATILPALIERFFTQRLIQQRIEASSLV